MDGINVTEIFRENGSLSETLFRLSLIYMPKFMPSEEADLTEAQKRSWHFSTRLWELALDRATVENTDDTDKPPFIEILRQIGRKNHNPEFLEHHRCPGHPFPPDTYLARRLAREKKEKDFLDANKEYYRRLFLSIGMASRMFYGNFFFYDTRIGGE